MAVHLLWMFTCLSLPSTCFSSERIFLYTRPDPTLLVETDSLEVLSIGGNQIKKLEGLEDVSSTLKALWISYNMIDKFIGIEKVQQSDHNCIGADG